MHFEAKPRARRLLLSGLVALAAVSANPSAAAVSPAVGKPLQAAISAAKAGNSGAAINAVNQARSAATTSEERTKVAQTAAYVYTAAGQYGKAAAELESIGAPPSQIAPLYYRAGQYDKAIAAAKKVGGESMQVLVAQAYTRSGRPQEAITAYQALIKSNGPKPLYLENLAGAQYKAGDKAGYLKTTTQLIKVDPSPTRWKTLLVNLLQNPMRAEAKLAAFYLMQQTGTMERQQDFLEFAKLAIVQNQPGTAVSTLSKAGDLSADPMSAKLAQAAQQRSATALAAAPKEAGNPETALKAGGAFLGAGQYPQAVAAYATAAKGPHTDQALVFGGIANVKAGNKAAARQLFTAVPTASPLKDVAELWSLYAST